MNQDNKIKRKIKNDKKKKKVFCLVLIQAVVLVAIILIAIIIDKTVVPLEYIDTVIFTPNITAIKEGELRIHFVDVGQGDSIIIQFPDKTNMIIDGGTEDSKENLLKYINSLNIKTFDYLVLTHPDNDHCGSLDEVVKMTKVKRAFIPYYTNTTAFTDSYMSFYDELLKEREEGAVVSYSQRYEYITSQSNEFEFYFTFISPHKLPVSPEYKNLNEDANEKATNNSSAVTYLQYKDKRILFTGDATSEIESDLLLELQLDDEIFSIPDSSYLVNLKDIDLLKVSHHGSNSSSSEEFLQYIRPKNSVISVGANLYGHPSENVLNRLSEVGSKIYRTDVQGSIIATISVEGELSIS